MNLRVFHYMEEQKKNEVDAMERIATELARLLVLSIDEINRVNSLENKKHESKEAIQQN